MADTSTVCSMCGDVGFPDKIFRCIRCRSRLQHSYCSNYYEAEEATEEATETAEVCDWCLSAERRHAGPSKKADSSSPRKRPESYPSSSSRVKRGSGREDSGPRGKSSSSSSKPGGRRYKLLKDVLC